MTVVPVQTYWGKEHAPEQYGCLDIAFLGPPPVQESYHVLRGELAAYQQAKRQVDQNPQYYLCSNGAHRIKLFL